MNTVIGGGGDADADADADEASNRPQNLSAANPRSSNSTTAPTACAHIHAFTTPWM
jgi:hypothetical protein